MRLCLDSHPQIFVFDQLVSEQLLIHKTIPISIYEGIDNKIAGFKTPKFTEKYCSN